MVYTNRTDKFSWCLGTTAMQTYRGIELNSVRTLPTSLRYQMVRRLDGTIAGLDVVTKENILNGVEK